MKMLSRKLIIKFAFYFYLITLDFEANVVEPIYNKNKEAGCFHDLLPLANSCYVFSNVKMYLASETYLRRITAIINNKLSTMAAM